MTAAEAAAAANTAMAIVSHQMESGGMNPAEAAAALVTSADSAKLEQAKLEAEKKAREKERKE